MTAPLAFTRHPVDDSIDAIGVCCAQGWTDGRRDEGDLVGPMYEARRRSAGSRTIPS